MEPKSKTAGEYKRAKYQVNTIRKCNNLKEFTTLEFIELLQNIKKHHEEERTMGTII